LNEAARFPAGPFALAVGLRVPVSFVFAIKESNLHYHFFASRLYRADQEDKEQQMQNLLNLYTGELEIKMKQFPEQWYNYYDFWKA
jgi:predicted LPLAT superfamily acyltransferase